MKGIVRKSFIALFAVLVGPGFLTYCGSAGNSASTASTTGTSGGSGVAVSGDVTVPSSTSTSVSVGSSLDHGVSKSVSKGSGDRNEGEKIIVSKAVSDVPANTGTVTAKTLAGAALDTGTISGGSIVGLVIDPAQLDATNQVLVEASVNGKKVTSIVDLTGKSNGQTASAGTVNTDTTLSTAQVYSQGNANCTPDNPSACPATFLTTKANIVGPFKISKGLFEDGTAAGSGTAVAAFKAMAKAMRAKIAGGTVSFLAMNQLMLGDATLLNEGKALDSSLGSIDMSAAIAHIKSYGPAVYKTMSDSTTFDKFYVAGSTGASAYAKHFGQQTSTECDNAASHPEVFQGYLNQNATAFNNGDTTAFNAMKKSGAARMIGQFAGNLKSGETFSSSQYEALKKLVDSQSSGFDTLAASKIAAMGESFCNQIRAADTATELTNLKANPATFAGKIFDNPASYIGTAGATAFDNQFATFVQNPSALTAAGAKGCSVDADCTTAGYECSPNKFCSPACVSNCGYGQKCTTNGQCTTGACGSNGACSAPTGSDPLAGLLKSTGATCTSNGQCFSQSCSSGVCAAPAPPAGSASFAKTYKKTNGQTPTCILNFQIDGAAGSTNVNFSPPDGSATPTFMGGHITFTGASSPFSIISGAIVNPTTNATGVLNCDGTNGSTTLALSVGRLTGTCSYVIGGSPLTCTIDHTQAN